MQMDQEKKKAYVIKKELKAVEKALRKEQRLFKKLFTIAKKAG